MTLIECESIGWKLVDRIILLSGACGLAKPTTVVIKGEWPMNIYDKRHHQQILRAKEIMRKYKQQIDGRCLGMTIVEVHAGYVT